MYSLCLITSRETALVGFLQNPLQPPQSSILPTLKPVIRNRLAARTKEGYCEKLTDYDNCGVSLIYPKIYMV